MKRDFQTESEHFYIQIQEQKKKRLAELGILPEQYRLALTRKYLRELTELCHRKQFDLLVVELMSGSNEELTLIKALKTTNIPIRIYTHSLDENFYKNTDGWEFESILSLTEILKIS